MEQYKTCKRCFATKSVLDFGKDRTRKDLLCVYCRECSRQIARDHYQANATKISARQQGYRNQNPEKYKKLNRSYYAKNTELCKTRIADWQNRNKHKVIEYVHVRRQRLNEEVYQISHREITNLQEGPCFYCGIIPAKTIDHIVPLSRGGLHKIGNLVGACKSCNSSKNDKFIMEWRFTKML